MGYYFFFRLGEKHFKPYLLFTFLTNLPMMCAHCNKVNITIIYFICFQLHGDSKRNPCSSEYDHCPHSTKNRLILYWRAIVKRGVCRGWFLCLCACEQSEGTVFVCRAFLSVCLWEVETDVEEATSACDGHLNHRT